MNTQNTEKIYIKKSETNLVENVPLNGYFGIDIEAKFVMCGWCSILNSFIKLFATLNSVFFYIFCVI